MFHLFKKKKTAYGGTVGNNHSGNAEIEAMKDEFFKYYNKGEEVGVIMGEEYYEKAFQIANEWITKENTNRSYGCLAAAAFKLGTFDREKLKIAHDTYKMLAETMPEYNAQLKATEDLINMQEKSKQNIQSILNKKK